MCKRKFVRNDDYKKIKEKNDNCKYLVFYPVTVKFFM